MLIISIRACHKLPAMMTFTECTKVTKIGQNGTQKHLKKMREIVHNLDKNLSTTHSEEDSCPCHIRNWQCKRVWDSRVI